MQGNAAKIGLDTQNRHLMVMDMNRTPNGGSHEANPAVPDPSGR